MLALLISGSVSPTSHTRALLGELSLALSERGSEVSLWDLRLEPLPIADPAHHATPDSHPNDAVRRFVRLVDRADAVALGSPLYHGSFSGVLKNALDHLRYDGFRNKPVALLSHGSSERRCTQPCEALQTVVKTLYGYSLQTQVATTKSDYQLSEDGPVVYAANVVERVSRQSHELVQLAALLSGRQIEKED